MPHWNGNKKTPNYLYVRFPDGPEQVYKRGNDYLAEIVQHNSRIPFGHPEAFIEAFANVYVNAARTISAKIAGEAPGEFDTDFPTVQDGARGYISSTPPWRAANSGRGSTRVIRHPRKFLLGYLPLLCRG